jgi:hypothetical protein
MITSYKRKRVDDVDDDDDAFDEAGVLKDGRSLRVPLSFMDAYHRAEFNDVAVHDGLGNPAGHRPGFVYETTLARPAHHARDAYVKWLGEAWRQPRGDAASHASTTDAAPPAASLSKEDAYREYCEYLSNAWRRGR